MKHAQQTIADLEARLQQLNAESQKIKSAINCLCDVMGEPPKYDLDEKPEQMGGQRPDEYYGRPLATVITEVLENRHTNKQGAASLDELFEQLVAGGYAFTGKSDGIKKRGLAISMSKNKKFHHVPNDTWGLVKWYPNAKEVKESNKELAQAETEIKEDSASTESVNIGIDDSSHKIE